jgi:hypothetical protein
MASAGTGSGSTEERKAQKTSAARKAEEAQTRSYAKWAATVRELDSAVKLMELELGLQGTGRLFEFATHKSTNTCDDFRKGICRVGLLLSSLRDDTRADTEKFGKDSKGNLRSPKNARPPSHIYPDRKCGLTDSCLRCVMAIRILNM